MGATSDAVVAPSERGRRAEGRLRCFLRPSFRTAFFAAAPVALAVVVGAIPGRWEGSRTQTDAYVPLRPLTPRQAALLLRHPSLEGAPLAIVVDVDDGIATVRTTHYVLNVPASFCAGSPPGDRCYTDVLASGSGFLCEHRVDAQALREELGAELVVRPRDTLPGWVTFFSYLLPLYVVAETVLLALVFASLLSRLAASSPWLWLPWATVHSALLLVAIPIYSPAFFDYDYFYQRIVVEELWGRLGQLMIPLGLLSVPALLIHGARRSPLDHHLPRRLWRLASRLMLGAGTVALVVDAGMLVSEFFEERVAADAGLARVVARLDYSTRLILLDAALERPFGEDLLAGPMGPEARAELVEVLAYDTADRRTLMIFLAAGGGRYLFLHNAGTYYYADLRNPSSTWGFGRASLTLQTGASRASFWEFLHSGYTATAPIMEGSERVGAAVVQPRPGDDRHQVLRTIFFVFEWVLEHQLPGSTRS